MATTQDHLRIQDIKSDLILLKDGGISLVMQTTAVNFGLLSEEEQVAIIYSFAGLLNSLSFPIQIVVRSERLDVSNYVVKLQALLKNQSNPLLAKMIASYTEFIKSVIKDNEVLDKQFYIIINVTGVETGVLTRNSEDKIKKAQTVLTPRKEHLIRQLSRVGLKARQLTSEELVKLFYDIYNGTDEAAGQTVQETTPTQPSAIASTQKTTLPIRRLATTPSPSPTATAPSTPTINRPAQSIPINPAPSPRPLNVTRLQQPTSPAPSPLPQAQVSNAMPQMNLSYQMPKRTPFIVEELTD